MTTASMKAKVIRIEIEHDDSGLCFATSADLKGLLVAKQTQDELRMAVPQAIKNLYAACEVDVVVTEIEDEKASWVAVPVVAAARASKQVQTA